MVNKVDDYNGDQNYYIRSSSSGDINYLNEKKNLFFF